MVDVPRHTGCRIAVADAVSENDAGQVVAAGKDRGKIAAFVASGGHSDDITLQSRQIERAVGPFIAGPQLHAAERPHRGFRAIQLFGFDFLVFHSTFIATLMLKRLSRVRRFPVNPELTSSSPV